MFHNSWIASAFEQCHHYLFWDHALFYYSGQGACSMVSFSKQRSLLRHFVLHKFKLIPFSLTNFLKYFLQEVSNYQCRLVTKPPRAKQNCFRVTGAAQAQWPWPCHLSPATLLSGCPAHTLGSSKAWSSCPQTRDLRISKHTQDHWSNVTSLQGARDKENQEQF